jgi:hypothetical protein
MIEEPPWMFVYYDSIVVDRQPGDGDIYGYRMNEKGVPVPVSIRYVKKSSGEH